MPKGHPISVPKVPWHEKPKPKKCCGTGCSRCMRKLPGKGGISGY